MSSEKRLKKAILQTICYANIFDYPLSAQEIHRYLIGNATASQQQVKKLLQKLKKENVIAGSGNLFHLKNQKHSVDLRRNRKKIANEKTKIAKRVSRWLKFIPSVKAVVITGALAMENSDSNDDIDLMIITKKNRLWLARGLVTILVSFVAKRRKPFHYSEKTIEGRVKDAVCLNLFLDESALAIPDEKRDLYTAHEVIQTKWLWDRGKTREKFFLENIWVKQYLPNTRARQQQMEKNKESKSQPTKALSKNKGATYKLLDNCERFAYLLQKRYMQKKLTNELITQNSAYFHPRKTANYVLKEFNRRVVKLNAE